MYSASNKTPIEKIGLTEFINEDRINIKNIIEEILSINRRCVRENM